MAEPNLTQVVAAVVALLTGVALGLVVDGRRALQVVGRPGRWTGHALDVAAVAAMTPLVAAGLVAADWGALRFFILAAMAVGLWLYLAWGSPLLLPLAVCGLRLVVRGARGGARLLAGPPRVALRAARRPVRRLGIFAGRAARGLWRRPPPPSAS